MPRSSLAGKYFDQIAGASTPYTELCSLVGSSPPTFENEWRDFKTADRLNDDKLKETWSRALSGFANSGGGVLIFGIDARKDKATGIDYASGLALAPSPHRLKSRLLELHAFATEPPIQGVQVESYTEGGKDGPGFVVCFVPESADRPHRAEYCQRQFFIRAGDDFCIPSVSLLRILFYPHSRSRVTPYLRIKTPLNDPRFKAIVGFWVENTGTATATDVFVQIDYDPKFSPVTRPSPEVLVLDESSNPCFRSLKRPLHPGIRARVLDLRFANGTDFHDGFRCSVSLFSGNAEPIKWLFRCAHCDFLKPDLLKRPDQSKSILYHVESGQGTQPGSPGE
jgi:hypothetical protein